MPARAGPLLVLLLQGQCLTSTISHHFAALHLNLSTLSAAIRVLLSQCVLLSVFKHAVPSLPLRAPAMLAVLTPGIGNAI